MDVLIVGAGLVAYGCAYAALQDGHKVHVADHSIEFGLPNMWPSVLLDRDSIPLSFSTDQNFEGSFWSVFGGGERQKIIKNR